MLYMKKHVMGIVYIALYVNNILMIGDIAAIDDTIAALKSKGLVLKIVAGLQDYLSGKVKISDDKKRDWLGQPHLIKNMEEKFGENMQDVRSHKAPGMPKFFDC